jgi:iron complex outermembrane receptor protein
MPSVADVSLRDAEGSAIRSTLRANSVLHLAESGPTRLTLTFSGEQVSLRDATAAAPNSRYPSWSTETTSPVSWQNSTGVGAQANVAVENALFLTTGFRVEYDSRLNAAQQFVTLPMVGVATLRDFGPLTVKMHASYGKGVRPPSALDRSQFLQSRGGQIAQPALDAEEQSGTEAGLDVMLHRALSLHVTRFDQLATGLIQQVAIPAEPSVGSRRVGYLLENVGEISNHGWELEGSTGVGRLQASGTLSFIDSRVTKVANGYTGDLVVGGRMLAVPARTGSFNLSWLADRWSVSAGGERALDWFNYDQIALSQALMSGDHAAREFVGPQLRQYWREYDGGLHLHAAASRDLRNGFAIEIRGDNLLNYQRNEPDNITIVPGRTIMTGLRIKF